MSAFLASDLVALDSLTQVLSLVSASRRKVFVAPACSSRSASLPATVLALRAFLADFALASLEGCAARLRPDAFLTVVAVGVLRV